jgi:transposase
VTSKRYDQEFKDNAVNMLVMSGKALSVVARELGVSDTALRKWKEKHLGEADRHPRGEGMPTPAEMADKIKSLSKELAHVTWQRDILKKAAGILSEKSQTGMP